MKQLLILLLAFFVSLNVYSQGNCDQEDLQYINENNEFVQSVAADCGADCIFSADPEGCLTTCMQAQTTLSTTCIGCFALQVECATSNCFFDCAFGAAEDCADCIAINCLEGFNECAGIVDADGDGFTTLNDCDDGNGGINPGALEIWYDGIDQNCDGLNDFDQDGDGEMAFEFGGLDCDDTDPTISGGAQFYFLDADNDGFGDLSSFINACSAPDGYVLNNQDCDDNNSNVYPNAPGTGQGIDNNCNNLIDMDEDFVCLGDLNNSGSIDVSDVLILLTDIGCSGQCTADLNNDTTVNTGDLLLLLSVFGSPCN